MKTFLISLLRVRKVLEHELTLGEEPEVEAEIKMDHRSLQLLVHGERE